MANNVRKEVESAIKKEQKWVLKSYIDTDRKRSTRYTSYVHHDLSEYVVDKGTLLHLAVLFDKPEMIKYLLAKGLDANARADAAYRISYRVGVNSAQKPTPIQLAVLLYRHKCLEVLMGAGADLQAHASGERLLSSEARVVKGTLAHLCVLWGRLTALNMILRSEPSLAYGDAQEVMRFGLPADNCYAIKGASPLHLAILLNHIESLEELLVFVTDTNEECRFVHLGSDARDKAGVLRGSYDYTKKSVTPIQLGERLGRAAMVDLLGDRAKLKALRAGGKKREPRRKHADGESSENLDREGSVRHRVHAGAADADATTDASEGSTKRRRKRRSSAKSDGADSTTAGTATDGSESGKKKRRKRASKKGSKKAAAAAKSGSGSGSADSNFVNEEADADAEFFRGDGGKKKRGGKSAGKSSKKASGKKASGKKAKAAKKASKTASSGAEDGEGKKKKKRKRSSKGAASETAGSETAGSTKKKRVRRVKKD